ncbi:MAG: hypothetical protein MSH11_02220 [Ruminococcus sp.]|nr:hypothetical protein [Ruminococcus sp.]
MSKLSFNKKVNYLLTKIIFYLNIPLVLMYFPILYLTNNSNGVYTASVPFLEGAILFAICFAVFLLVKGDMGVMLQNVALNGILLFILQDNINFALRLIVSPSIGSESSLISLFCVIIYYTFACLIVGIAGLIFLLIKRCICRKDCRCNYG